MPNGAPVFRFAPSPNGRLHLGHAYSALMNQRLADRAGGAVLLRLENIDVERCTPALEAAIEEDLGWLGFRWRPPVLRQSLRFPAYEAALTRLGDLLYPCFCSRGDILRGVGRRTDWARDPDGSPVYPGTCRTLAVDERERRLQGGAPPAWRLDVGAAMARCRHAFAWTEFREGDEGARVAAEPERWGDVVIARKGVPTSYHLAVVTDDAAQAVTDIVRGEDLYHATSLHRLLQMLLDLPQPRYHHHRLIVDTAGLKLSKSRNAQSLAALRADGAMPATIRRDLGF